MLLQPLLQVEANSGFKEKKGLRKPKEDLSFNLDSPISLIDEEVA
jgi:hypothetical protein